MVLVSLLIACHPPDPTGDTCDVSPGPEETGSETGTATGPTPPLPPEHQALREELEAAGFVVRLGAAQPLDTADCCRWESCYLFNPDNEYMGWALPRGPDQLAPNPAEGPDGRSIIWRLRPDEAVVAVGRTPPPAAYFSFRTYLHDRWYPELGAREEVLLSLGDSLNDLVIGTGPGGPSDAGFVLITTADAATETAVRAAAARAGLEPGSVNTDAVAGDDLRLGLHPEADGFRLQTRMALFEDPAAGDAYLAAPPITVFRITPAVEQPHVPLEAPPLRPRGTGADESAWLGALDQLDAAIVAAHPEHVATRLPVYTGQGDECPPGCNRDTFFGSSFHYELPAGADAFVMVFGVNHERTGKSVYSNFSVIDAVQHASPGAVHSRQMPGSARPYLDHPQVDDLYAWKVARDCAGEPFCLEVPYACPGFGSAIEGSLAFRAYTEPATRTGPLTSELLVDRAVLFTRP